MRKPRCWEIKELAQDLIGSKWRSWAVGSITFSLKHSAIPALLNRPKTWSCSNRWDVLVSIKTKNVLKKKKKKYRTVVQPRNRKGLWTLNLGPYLSSFFQPTLPKSMLFQVSSKMKLPVGNAGSSPLSLHRDSFMLFFFSKFQDYATLFTGY